MQSTVHGYKSVAAGHSMGACAGAIGGDLFIRYILNESLKRLQSFLHLAQLTILIYSTIPHLINRRKMVRIEKLP